MAGLVTASRLAALNPIFGLPSPPPYAGLPPIVRQVASASATGNVVLPAAPNQNSVLLVGQGSTSASAPAPAVSGGGATWVRLGDTTATTNQVRCALWLGVVGSSPSATINVTFLGAGNTYVAELSAGVTGRILGANTDTSGNQVVRGLSQSYLVYPDLYPSRFAVLVSWYVARFAPGTQFPETGWTWDPAVVSSNVRYRMRIRPIPFGNLFTWSAPTGNTANHCCVSAVLS